MFENDIKSKGWLQNEIDNIQSKKNLRNGKLNIFEQIKNTTKKEINGICCYFDTFLIEKEDQGFITKTDVFIMKEVVRSIESRRYQDKDITAEWSINCTNEENSKKNNVVFFRLKLYVFGTKKSNIDNFIDNFSSKHLYEKFIYVDKIRIDNILWYNYYYPSKVNNILLNNLLEDIENESDDYEFLNKGYMRGIKFKLKALYLKRAVIIFSFSVYEYEIEYFNNDDFAIENDDLIQAGRDEVNSWTRDNPEWEWNVD